MRRMEDCPSAARGNANKIPLSMVGVNGSLNQRPELQKCSQFIALWVVFDQLPDGGEAYRP